MQMSIGAYRKEPEAPESPELECRGDGVMGACELPYLGVGN